MECYVIAYRVIASFSSLPAHTALESIAVAKADHRDANAGLSPRLKFASRSSRSTSTKCPSNLLSMTMSHLPIVVTDVSLKQGPTKTPVKAAKPQGHIISPPTSLSCKGTAVLCNRR